MARKKKPGKKADARKHHRHGHGRAVHVKDIVIKDTSPISTSDDQAHLSISNGDQARWKHEHKKRFYVQFVSSSPFAETIFTNGDSDSGAITYTGAYPAEFKYQIGVGSDTVDPKIIIDP